MYIICYPLFTCLMLCDFDSIFCPDCELCQNRLNVALLWIFEVKKLILQNNTHTDAHIWPPYIKTNTQFLPSLSCVWLIKIQSVCMNPCGCPVQDVEGACPCVCFHCHDTHLEFTMWRIREPKLRLDLPLCLYLICL